MSRPDTSPYPTGPTQHRHRGRREGSREPGRAPRCPQHMTTRRDLFIIAGGATLLGGCRDEPRAAVSVPDVVLAGTRQGLAVLGGPHPLRLGREAVASTDGS